MFHPTPILRAALVFSAMTAATPNDAFAQSPDLSGRWTAAVEFGELPVNPSGGLLSKGHPVGASGVAQVVEIAWHLRGQAEKRQIEDAKVGLAQIMGGSKEGDTRACTVHIFEKR